MVILYFDVISDGRFLSRVPLGPFTVTLFPLQSLRYTCRDAIGILPIRDMPVPPINSSVDMVFGSQPKLVLRPDSVNASEEAWSFRQA